MNRCRCGHFTAAWLFVLMALQAAAAQGASHRAGLPLEPEVAVAPYSPDTGSIAVQCGALIDGVSGRAQHRATVVIRTGRVVSVDRGYTRPAGMPVLSLRNHTCLPGLIDMHTHLTDRPQDNADLQVFFTRSDAEQAANSAQHARATLLAGFTTVRNVGTYIAWTDKALRNEINAGRVAGPRMQVVGFYLTIPGGGGDLRIPGVSESDIPARVRAGVSRGPEEFARHAQAAVDGGADCLKIIASGAVLAYGGVPADPEMNPEEIAAVVQVGHAAGLKVAAHAHGALSIKQAILAGVDTIEHASYIDDEGIRLARSRGVALSMDIYNGDYIDKEGRQQGRPAEFLRKNIETTEVQRQMFTRAHAAGVPIVFGTDSGVYPHGLNARQFPIMVSRGMTPMEAIQAATSVAARYLGWSDRVGQISPGRFGDLIAVEGDPLLDISELKSVDVVIKGGLAFKLPRPQTPAASRAAR
jgi:imidazolonepropionase-like amidohydrolase